MELSEKERSRFARKSKGHLPENSSIGVSKTTPSRMVYEFAWEPFLIEELRLFQHLPSTVHYDELLAERKRKRSEINMDFYTTEEMINRDWMDTNQPQWHVLTRFSVHGFHHKFCVKAGFH